MELYAKAVVLDLQFAHLVMDNCLHEGLNSKLEISSRQQNVLPDVFMGARMFLKEFINRYSINAAFFVAINVDVGNMVILQKCSEVF